MSTIDTLESFESVKQSERTFRDKFSIHFGRCVEFRQNHHAFPHFFPTDSFQSERSGLASRTYWHRYPFSFNRPYMGIGELTERIGSNENGVASMNDSYNSSAPLLIGHNG